MPSFKMEMGRGWGLVGHWDKLHRKLLKCLNNSNCRRKLENESSPTDLSSKCVLDQTKLISFHTWSYGLQRGRKVHVGWEYYGFWHNGMVFGVQKWCQPTEKRWEEHTINDLESQKRDPSGEFFRDDNRKEVVVLKCVNGWCKVGKRSASFTVDFEKEKKLCYNEEDLR